MHESDAKKAGGGRKERRKIKKEEDKDAQARMKGGKEGELDEGGRKNRKDLGVDRREGGRKTMT